MGIPLAALAVRSPRIEGPLDQMTKAVRLKSLLQGQEVNEAYLQRMKRQQQAQQAQQEEQGRTQSLFREVGGDWEEFFKKAAGRGISMGTLLKLKESYRKDQQEYRAQSVEERLARKEQMALYGNEVAAVLALPENQRKASFMQRVQALAGQGSLEPQQAQQFAQLAQLPDEEFNRQLDLIRLSAIGATKLFEAEEKREQRTVKEKDFQAWYKTEREALGLKRTAKLEQQKRAEYRKLDEKKPTSPFAAFASGDPKQQKLAREWVALQSKYRRLTQGEAGLTASQKRQVDSINAQFNREMEVIKAQIQFDQPTEEQTRRMEEILQKANDDYDAVLGVKAPVPAGAAKKKLDAETARRFLKEAGGDKEKARQLARARGYVF